jgi:hypothetical protein
MAADEVNDADEYPGALPIVVQIGWTGGTDAIMSRSCRRHLCEHLQSEASEFQ